MLDRSKLLKARKLLASSNSDQLALGRLLLGVKATGEYYSFCKAVPIHIRKAYCLIDVAMAVDAGKLTESDVVKLGWTKCYIIAAKAKTKTQAAKAALFAVDHSCEELKTLFSGVVADPLANRTFNLPPPDAALLDKMLLAFGALPSSRGLADREAALMKIVRKAQSSVKLKVAA